MLLRYMILFILTINSYSFISYASELPKKIKRLRFAPYAECKTYAFGEATVSLATCPVQLPDVRDHELPAKPEKSASHDEWCRYRNLLRPWGSRYGSKLPKKRLGDDQHLPALTIGQRVSYNETSGVVIAIQELPLQEPCIVSKVEKLTSERLDQKSHLTQAQASTSDASLYQCPLCEQSFDEEDTEAIDHHGFKHCFPEIASGFVVQVEGNEFFTTIDYGTVSCSTQALPLFVTHGAHYLCTATYCQTISHTRDEAEQHASYHFHPEYSPDYKVFIDENTKVTVKLETQDIIECLVSDLNIVPERKLARYLKEFCFGRECEADKAHTKAHGTPFEKFIEHQLDLATKRSADYRPYHDQHKSGYQGSVCWGARRALTGDSRVRHHEMHAANESWGTPCRCKIQRD